MTLGTVAKLMIQGNAIRPDRAKMNQLFSHRHFDMRFMGAAKLPCRRPATTTTRRPHTKFPLIIPLGLLRSPRLICQHTQNTRKTVTGENEPSAWPASSE